jgi:hypothetical protein
MRTRSLFSVAAALVIAGCAQLQSGDEPGGYAARMNARGERYVACVTQEADTNVKNPAAAEDIAIAAHARCYSAWDGYRAATNATFLRGATTRAEIQLARDKADAHLRQFELETRRMIVDRMVERNLRGGKPAP